MTPDPHTRMHAWLAAEASDDTDQAEAALHALIVTLPRQTPRAGFSERVMWAVRPAPVARRRQVTVWAHAGIGAALALAGLVMALWPALRPALRPALGALPTGGPLLSTLIGAGARAVTLAAGWMDAGVELWDILARTGNAIGVAATTPAISTALLASALIGALALYSLHHLLVPERSHSS